MSTPKQILVVDDEASLVQLCQIILEEAGYRVRGAFNGRQALRLVNEEVPDLILLDVMMPGMTGIEVCEQIRNQHNGRPFIVMYTADDRDETRTNSLTAGANDVITKDTPIFEVAGKLESYFAAG